MIRTFLSTWHKTWFIWLLLFLLISLLPGCSQKPEVQKDVSEVDLTELTKAVNECKRELDYNYMVIKNRIDYIKDYPHEAIFKAPLIKNKKFEVGDKIKIYYNSGLRECGKKIFYRGRGEIVEIDGKGNYRIYGYILEPAHYSFHHAHNPNRDVYKFEVKNVLINPDTLRQTGISFYFIQ